MSQSPDQPSSVPSAASDAGQQHADADHQAAADPQHGSLANEPREHPDHDTVLQDGDELLENGLIWRGKPTPEQEIEFYESLKRSNYMLISLPRGWLRRAADPRLEPLEDGGER